MGLSVITVLYFVFCNRMPLRRMRIGKNVSVCGSIRKNSKKWTCPMTHWLKMWFSRKCLTIDLWKIIAHFITCAFQMHWIMMSLKTLLMSTTMTIILTINHHSQVTLFFVFFECPLKKQKEKWHGITTVISKMRKWMCAFLWSSCGIPQKSSCNLKNVSQKQGTADTAQQC